MTEKPLISIVSPEYKGELMVDALVSRIKQALSPITEAFEIILVNDASPDNTWEEIRRQCAKDKRVKGINLSRNFGWDKPGGERRAKPPSSCFSGAF